MRTKSDTKDILVADSFGRNRVNACRLAITSLQEAIISINNYSDYESIEWTSDNLDENIAEALVRVEQFAMYFNRVEAINEARERVLDKISENLRYGG